VSELLDQFARVAASRQATALATLVAAAGATPKKTGSTMWVAADGSLLGSVTIGGCVDARVIERAEEVIRTGQPALLRMSLGDEDAWELGLTCGGVVDVLVQRVQPEANDPATIAYLAARDAYDAGRASIVVSRLDERPERLAVDENGIVTGTLGGEPVDLVAVERARKRLAEASASGVERVPNDDGELALFYERLAPPETIVIYGASHVAMSLAVFAHELGMRCVIVDGRERMAARERFPLADEIRVGMPSEIADELGATKRSYVVLLAHDYKYDLPVLRQVLRSDAAYVGMLGSRRRGDTIRGMLAEEGFTAAELARLHSPIGLPLGGKSAAEIALAIAAEIIAVREGRGREESLTRTNAAWEIRATEPASAVVR
jgi:xanthine dehydrogenase accessory factor